MMEERVVFAWPSDALIVACFCAVLCSVLYDIVLCSSVEASKRETPTLRLAKRA
jgi:hypothetical protein